MVRFIIYVVVVDACSSVFSSIGDDVGLYEESSGCGRESRILLCSKLSRVWAFGLGKCMGVCKKIQNFLPGPLNREQLDRRYYGG
jgi:hypothetical protein